ncbi:capsular polysaccharide export protein [Breoghania corrubedonensis]|uniref:Capsular polysaccharide export protein n=1 Tax=Breoghania corrubedonensis TaxID=665038 RepID=A0A2T5VB29_9HYPH|nr:capsular biosynthesis protein [Breoghania corrubedonensis]PTW60955.1 capsular polysaccharide export protein [Breoghania corrubedonensis]
MTARQTTVRTVLFLQGPPSLFLRDLAVVLARRGHRTCRINLNLGDWLFWPRRGAVNYRGRLRDWRAFLTDYVSRHGVTDIVYYADRLPYHVIAGEVGRAGGINVIALEFGYLRPDWITLERNGMSAYSHFPADPQVIRELGKDLVAPSAASLYSFPHAKEAFCEVLYNLTSYFGRPFYPHYYADRIYNPVIEYISHIPRILSTRGNQRRSHKVLHELVDRGTPYYLFALQIDADYQLRANAPFRRQADAVKLAISSFAKHAPKDTVLLFKQHPLDNAMTHWKSRIHRLARRYKVPERVRFVRAGDLRDQLTHARGTVLINSTVGIHALKHGCPVKTLGVAIYDMPGLTFQGPLDDFWTKADKPDPDLCHALVAVMANTIQVRGNFYSRAGRNAGARAAAERIARGCINEPGALVEKPPRLARARRMGLQPADDLGRQNPQRGLIEPDQA